MYTTDAQSTSPWQQVHHGVLGEPLSLFKHGNGQVPMQRRQNSAATDGRHSYCKLPMTIRREDPQNKRSERHDSCCGQLWVRNMICGQTCDGLYHFAFCLIIFGIPFGSRLMIPTDQVSPTLSRQIIWLKTEFHFKFAALVWRFKLKLHP